MTSSETGSGTTFLSGSGGRADLWLIVVFCLGALFQSVYAYRSGIGLDQIDLLAMGLSTLNGDLVPVSKAMSGGGGIPGWLLQWVVAAPLALWRHYQAPVILVGLGHLAAGSLLLLTLRRAMGPAFAAAFGVVYWLAPWRLLHAGVTWEPSLIYLPAALHLWAGWRSRRSAGVLESAVLGALVTITAQLHASFLILAVATGVAWLRGVVRVHGVAFAVGLGLGGLTLVPTLVAWFAGALPPVAPSEGFPGRGLILVYPIFRALSYWLRLGSLDVGRPFRDTSFFEADGLVGGFADGLQYAGLVTIVIAAAASWLYFRPILARGATALWRTPGDGRADETGSANWLREYAFCYLLAVLAVAALSPLDLQRWHVAIALHAAALPVADFVVRYWGGKAWLRTTIMLFIALRIPMITMVGMGHPWYQREVWQGRDEAVQRIGPVLPPRLLESLGETAP